MLAPMFLAHTHPGVRESKNANPKMSHMLLEDRRVVSSRLLPVAMGGMEGWIMKAQDSQVPGMLASRKDGQDGSVLGCWSTVLS